MLRHYTEKPPTYVGVQFDGTNVDDMAEILGLDAPPEVLTTAPEPSDLASGVGEPPAVEERAVGRRHFLHDLSGFGHPVPIVEGDYLLRTADGRVARFLPDDFRFQEVPTA